MISLFTCAQLPLEEANDWCEEKGMALVTLETVKELDSLIALIGLNTSEKLLG
jgi:hypothetical protein